MVERLLNLALVGGEPILYLLIALSLLSIAIVIERSITYLRNSIDVPAFRTTLVELLNKGDIKGAIAAATRIKSAESAVTLEGLQNFDKGSRVAGELMEAMTMRRQQQLDRWLTVLGTIGSNAPFVGLLGTVLGIIQAFRDLAFDSQSGPSVVMAGIAEALVATAVGLLVAIPAVVCFNYFKNRQTQILSNIAQLERTLLAFIEDGQNNTKQDKQGL